MWRKTPEPRPSSPAADAHPPAAASHPGPAERSGPAPEPRSETTRITKGVAVRGEISGREDLYIDGEVQGSIRLADAGVTVGPNGRVTAEMDAREITIHGRVEGSLRARERVAVGRSGNVTGDVATHRIVIEEGAVFNGTIDIVRPEDARAPRANAAVATGDAYRGVRLEAKDSVQ
jgi:cytoskeletal protein CcmA (bactofilin family)